MNTNLGYCCGCGQPTIDQVRRFGKVVFLCRACQRPGHILPPRRRSLAGRKAIP